MANLPGVRGRPFAKGQSGNPNGRPAGAKSFGTLLDRELNELVTVKEAGRSRRVTKREMVIKRLVAEGMAGSPRHISLILASDPVSAQILDEVRSAAKLPEDEAAKAALVERLRSFAADLTAADIGSDEEQV